MWDTREVTITLRLPHDIADQAEEVQKSDPEFLRRVVRLGLTRRGIYQQMQERKKLDARPEPLAEDLNGLALHDAAGALPPPTPPGERRAMGASMSDYGEPERPT